MKKLLAIIVAMVVILAACGDSSDSGGSASGADFCTQSREINDLTDEIDAADLSFDQQFKRLFDEVMPRMEQAAKSAPDEIKSDINTILSGMKDLKKELESVDYDITKLDPAVLDQPAMDQASDNIDEYMANVCGIDTGSSDGSGSGSGTDSGAAPDTSEASGSTDSGSTGGSAAATIGEQMVAGLVQTGFTQDEAECIIGELDFSNINPDDVQADPSFIFDALGACDISLERMAELGS
ncbi:MAG TPA: hypothetical protein ENI86_04770 [Acidimicrobiales bacterium]|nr:hypothetical protein [Acidimicrobiales bacterium]